MSETITQETFQVVGIKNATFKDKETKEQIAYCKLYVTFKDEKTVGIACEAMSIKPELADGIQPGDEVQLFYNKYGKISDIKVL